MARVGLVGLAGLLVMVVGGPWGRSLMAARVWVVLVGMGVTRGWVVWVVLVGWVQCTACRASMVLVRC